MQCPNCGREAININGREICLDCGIEIARGVDMKEQGENVETEPVIPQESVATFGSSDNEDVVQNHPDTSSEVTENEGNPASSEVVTATASPEIPLDRDIAGDSESTQSSEEDLAADIISDQPGEPDESITHLDFKEEPTIEEIAENNVADPTPTLEEASDLLDLKADTGTSVNDPTLKPILDGADDEPQDSVEEAVAKEKEKTPIFADTGEPDTPDIPKLDITAAPETLNTGVQGKENYTEQAIPTTSANNESYTQGLPKQVDSINIGSLGGAPQSSPDPNAFLGNTVGVSDNSESYGYNADIMPARGVSRSTYRKIAIAMIIIVNIVVLTLVGITVKNRYMSSINEQTQEKPAGDF